LSYMVNDEFDTGRRNLLNFGHCFGHALETVSDYALPHGQAVVIGMLFANLAAVRRGVLSQELASHLADCLLLKSLSVQLRADYFAPEAIITAMQQDKKRVGAGLVMVLMHTEYVFEKITDFTADEVVAGITDLKQLLRLPSA